jgi:hypothetical protein
MSAYRRQSIGFVPISESTTEMQNVLVATCTTAIPIAGVPIHAIWELQRRLRVWQLFQAMHVLFESIPSWMNW